MRTNFIPLSCQHCGAKLDVYNDMERFACSYCGTEMLVQRRGGTVALKQIESAIQKVQTGTDKTAAELAMPRLQAELQQLTQAERSLSVPTTVLRFTLGHVLLGLGIAVAIFAPLWALVIDWGTFWERHDPLLRVALWVTALIIFLCGIWVWQQGRRRRKREKVMKTEETLRFRAANESRLAEIRSELERVKAQMLENRRTLDS